MSTWRMALILGAVSLIGAAVFVARAQQAPAQNDDKAKGAEETHAYSPSRLDVPPRKSYGGYPFSPYIDAEIADPDVHRVLYQDAHVMLLEVSNPPGLDVHMHGHPYPTVTGQDIDNGGGGAAAPAVTPGSAAAIAGANANLNDPKLDPSSDFNDMGSGSGAAPKGLKFPTCSTSAPQAPHKPINRGTAPLHFYRMEFRRVDGDDLQRKWKEWYPEMTAAEKPVKDLTPGPTLGPNYSEQWPYPIGYDSVQAAPNNYQLLYEDGKIRFIEVRVRPGETTPMHGNPYPAILAFDTVGNIPATVTETRLDPDSPLNGQGAGYGAAPKVHNMNVPTCMTMAPEAPHKTHNGSDTPLHYYRIEYKRIDGAGFRANWQKWYPWMMYMKYIR